MSAVGEGFQDVYYILWGFFVVDDVFLFVFLIQHVDMSQKNKYSSLLSLFTVRGD